MRCVVVAFVVVCVGCAGETGPRREPAPPPATPTPSSAELIARLPEGFRSVGWFRGDQAPILQVIEGLVPPPASRCLGELKAGLRGYIQGSQRDPGENVMIFFGTFERAAVEACVQVVSESLGTPVALQRAGSITTLSSGTWTSLLAWLPDGSVASSDDRALIDEVLAGTTSVRSDAALMALVARIDPSHAMWAVATTDLAALLVDVPSRGMFASGDLPTPDPVTGAARGRFPFTFVFASAADAARAVARYHAVTRDPRYSPQLQAALAAMRPVANGDTVEIDVVPLLSDAPVLEELNGILESVRAEQLRAQSPIPGN